MNDTSKGFHLVAIALIVMLIMIILNAADIYIAHNKIKNIENKLDSLELAIYNNSNYKILSENKINEEVKLVIEK